MITRRVFLALAAALALASGCAGTPSFQETPPIVFVHGNGDSAALWQTTLWRFESNGWPRERLHAFDVPYPLARDDDTKAQAGRTSAAQHMASLKAEIDKVLQSTGAAKVVLIGSSRGGSSIVNLKPERIVDADKDAAAIVTMTRPRGYLDPDRDRMSFDGQTPPPGALPGAGVSSSKIKLASAQPRSVVAEFNGERVTGRTWPAAEGHVSLLELTY